MGGASDLQKEVGLHLTEVHWGERRWTKIPGEGSDEHRREAVLDAVDGEVITEHATQSICREPHTHQKCRYLELIMACIFLRTFFLASVR